MMLRPASAPVHRGTPASNGGESGYLFSEQEIEEDPSEAYQRRLEIRTWCAAEVRQRLSSLPYFNSVIVPVRSSIRAANLGEWGISPAAYKHQQQQQDYNNPSPASTSTATEAAASWERHTLADAMFMHGIDGNALLELTQDDIMKTLEVKQLGTAKAILRNVRLYVHSAPVVGEESARQPMLASDPNNEDLRIIGGADRASHPFAAVIGPSHVTPVVKQRWEIAEEEEEQAAAAAAAGAQQTETGGGGFTTFSSYKRTTTEAARRVSDKIACYGLLDPFRRSDGSHSSDPVLGVIEAEAESSDKNKNTYFSYTRNATVTVPTQRPHSAALYRGGGGNSPDAAAASSTPTPGGGGGGRPLSAASRRLDALLEASRLKRQQQQRKSATGVFPTAKPQQQPTPATTERELFKDSATTTTTAATSRIASPPPTVKDKQSDSVTGRPPQRNFVDRPQQRVVHRAWEEEQSQQQGQQRQASQEEEEEENNKKKQQDPQPEAKATASSPAKTAHFAAPDAEDEPQLDAPQQEPQQQQQQAEEQEEKLAPVASSSPQPQQQEQQQPKITPSHLLPRYNEGGEDGEGAPVMVSVEEQMKREKYTPGMLERERRYASFGDTHESLLKGLTDGVQLGWIMNVCGDYFSWDHGTIHELKNLYYTQVKRHRAQLRKTRHARKKIEYLQKKKERDESSVTDEEIAAVMTKLSSLETIKKEFFGQSKKQRQQQRVSRGFNLLDAAQLTTADSKDGDEELEGTNWQTAEGGGGGGRQVQIASPSTNTCVAGYDDSQGHPGAEKADGDDENRMNGEEEDEDADEDDDAAPEDESSDRPPPLPAAATEKAKTPPPPTAAATTTTTTAKPKKDRQERIDTLVLSKPEFRLIMVNLVFARTTTEVDHFLESLSEQHGKAKLEQVRRRTAVQALFLKWDNTGEGVVALAQLQEAARHFTQQDYERRQRQLMLEHKQKQSSARGSGGGGGPPMPQLLPPPTGPNAPLRLGAHSRRRPMSAHRRRHHGSGSSRQGTATGSARPSSAASNDNNNNSPHEEGSLSRRSSTMSQSMLQSGTAGALDSNLLLLHEEDGVDGEAFCNFVESEWMYLSPVEFDDNMLHFRTVVDDVLTRAEGYGDARVSLDRLSSAIAPKLCVAKPALILFSAVLDPMTLVESYFSACRDVVVGTSEMKKEQSMSSPSLVAASMLAASQQQGSAASSRPGSAGRSGPAAGRRSLSPALDDRARSHASSVFHGGQLVALPPVKQESLMEFSVSSEETQHNALKAIEKYGIGRGYWIYLAFPPETISEPPDRFPEGTIRPDSSSYHAQRNRAFGAANNKQDHLETQSQGSFATSISSTIFSSSSLADRMQRYSGMMNSFLRRVGLKLTTTPHSMIHKKFRLFCHCPVDFVDCNNVPMVMRSVSVMESLLRDNTFDRSHAVAPLFASTPQPAADASRAGRENDKQEEAEEGKEGRGVGVTTYLIQESELFRVTSPQPKTSRPQSRIDQHQQQEIEQDHCEEDETEEARSNRHEQNGQKEDAGAVENKENGDDEEASLQVVAQQEQEQPEQPEQGQEEEEEERHHGIVVHMKSTVADTPYVRVPLIPSPARVRLYHHITTAQHHQSQSAEEQPQLQEDAEEKV